MDAFKRADVEKEVLATTLREHQAAVDATKSSAREAGIVSNHLHESPCTYKSSVRDNHTSCCGECERISVVLSALWWVGI